MAEIKIIGLLDVKREQDQRVYEGGGLAPCLRAENHEVKIMEIKNSIDKTRQDKVAQNQNRCQVVVLGNMDNTIDHTFESANRVYDKNNLCPTIPTCAGGGIQPKIIEETKCVGGLSDGKWGNQYHQQDRVYKGDIALAQPANLPEGSYKYIVAMRGRNPERPNDRTPGLPTEQRLEMAQEGMTNTLTTVQKDNLVLESCRMVRTEEGKRLRKAYENGEIKHGFNEYRELEPRKDGVCNTLTTVQKDNLLLEKKIQKVGQISNDGSQCGTVVSEKGLFPTISAGTHGYANAHIATQYRIRKLTPRETWRLMAFRDKDFDNAKEAGVSNTQLYKQSGNSICECVLQAIFLQMNIQGLKNWNDRTDEEKRSVLVCLKR